MNRPIRVLHVDDDPEFGDVTARVLERKDDNMEVITATSPEEGLDRLKRQEIDCVVADYKMPATDGLAFFGEVRETDPDVPFILLTGRGSEGVASQAISDGVTDYLQKGRQETYKLLLNRIKTAVAQRQTRKFQEVAKHPPMELLDRITDSFIALDNDWRFTYLNEGGEEMFGKSADELLGERIWDLYPEATGTPFYDHYHEAMESGEQMAVEQYFEPWDRWFREHIYPSDSGLSVVSHDITAEKQSQNQLERTHLRLDTFTEEATPVLEESFEAIQEHLNRAQLDCDSEHLQAVVEEFDRAETLTSHLLTLAEYTDAETQTVDLPSTVHTAWNRVANDGAILCIDTAQSIQADRTQLRRLLRSLFRNAVTHGTRMGAPDCSQHTNDSAEDLHVTVGATGSGFYVTDNGAGIPPDDREKVFEPGYSTAVGGTGFGLSVVKQVVHAHGWDIRLSESADGGARFDISGVEFEQ